MTISIPSHSIGMELFIFALLVVLTPDRSRQRKVKKRQMPLPGKLEIKIGLGKSLV
jgi:hypothetical protein